MSDILLSKEVLKLNKDHQAVGFFTPKKIFIGLANWQMDHRQVNFLLDGSGRRMRKMLAYDIGYAEHSDGTFNFGELTTFRLVDWDEWITLPIRSYDLFVRTSKLKIRIPRVVMSLLSEDMPKVKYGKDLDSVYNLYGGECQYTHKKISKSQASRDHVIPRSKGGADELHNIVLCDKDVNSKKGDHYNYELGLPEVKPIIPKELPIKDVLKNGRGIPEWDYFLKRR